MKPCLLLSLVLLTACHQTSTKQHEINQGVNVAQHFVQAYNKHDMNGMLQWVHDEVRYMFISGEQVYTETSGKQALENFLVGYFKANPKASSVILSTATSGPFIQQVEKAIWQDAAGNPQAQCSLSVYQTDEDLIINIWYFDAYPCP